MATGSVTVASAAPSGSTEIARTRQHTYNSRNSNANSISDSRISLALGQTIIRSHPATHIQQQEQQCQQDQGQWHQHRALGEHRTCSPGNAHSTAGTAMATGSGTVASASE